MGNFKIPNVVERNGSYYFQAKRHMRDGGIFSEALGSDLAAAIKRAEELNKAWQEVRSGKDQPQRAKAPSGTMARLIEDLRVSSEFRDKSTARQDELEYSFKHILPVFGPSRLNGVSPKHCEDFYDILRNRGSVHKAARVMKDLRYLFNRAKRQRLVTHNPALDVRVRQPPPRRVVWRADDVSQVIEEAWSEGYEGLAVGISILYDTSMSPVDLRKLTPNDIRDDHTFLERAKSGRGQYAVYSAETLTLIERYQRESKFKVLPTTQLVRTRRGRPYSKDQLARDFRRIADKVGLPKNVQMRDLRRTAHTERLEGGAHPQEARAAIGNSVDRNKTLDDTYSVYSLDMARAAERKRREHKTGPKV